MENEDAASSFRSGRSLPVPNVQALAAASNGSTEIPHRYVRPEVESDPVIGAGRVHLPLVDLSRLLDPNLFQEESAKLKMACEEWGFFQLINHRIPEDVISEMKSNILEFFKLPLKEKEAYRQLPKSLEGYGQAFVTSEEQKLDWADMMYLITRPPSSRNVRFWPTYPPRFRDALERYSSEVKGAAESLLGFMARSLGLNLELFLTRLKDKSQAVRINYYPPCPKATTVVGLSPHTDGVGLTLLLQVSDTQGLQIKEDGTWVPIQVLPEALIVNIGDILEIMSNGRFKSVEHRVMVNPQRERISIAAFHSPSSGDIVGPLPEFTRGGVKYRSMSYDDYMKVYLSSKLEGRSLLERLKIVE